MTRPILATCDYCHNITTVDFIEKEHDQGIKETYFECIHCQHHYICFVTDQKVRTMQQKAERLRAVKNQSVELFRLQKRINKQMDRLKQDMIRHLE